MYTGILHIYNYTPAFFYSISISIYFSVIPLSILKQVLHLIAATVYPKVRLYIGCLNILLDSTLPEVTAADKENVYVIS